MARRVADVVALIVAIVVGVVTLLGALVLTVVQLTDPDRDMPLLVASLAEVVGALAAGLAGYLAGQRWRRRRD